jgi:hypothetical protein
LVMSLTSMVAHLIVTQPKARVFYFFGSSFFSKLF